MADEKRGEVAKFGPMLQKLTGEGGKYLTQKRRKEVPASRFLLVEGGKRLFPVYLPNGQFSCKLALAAIHRAAQYNYPAVETKAKNLYKQHNCGATAEATKALRKG